MKVVPSVPVLKKSRTQPSFAEKFSPFLSTTSEGAISLTAHSKEHVKSETNTFVVFFDFDSVKFNRDSEATLDAAAEAATEGQEIRIFATAHTDASGSSEYNLMLSQKRAEKIREAFIKRGIELERIDLHAFGEQRPRVSTPDGLPEHRNRRVEIVVGPAPNI